MRSILELIESSPVKAIEAGLRGLKRLESKEGYVNNMYTYGDFVEGKCHGCLATAALQELAGVDLDANNIGAWKTRADAFELSYDEMMRFQCAMDYFRHSTLLNLYVFCGIEHDSSVDNALYGNIYRNYDNRTHYADVIGLCEDAVKQLKQKS